MWLSKKFTAEFPHYVRNVFICSTSLFSRIEYQKGCDETKNYLKENSKLLHKEDSLSDIDKNTLKVVSYNIMKFINKEDIIDCFENYINNWTDVFLLQEVIILDWVNYVQDYFEKKWFHTYFHPTSKNDHKTKLSNFEFIWVMLASKLPMNKTDFLFYDIVRPQQKLYNSKNYFGIWYVQVSLNNKNIWLYCTHSEWFTKPSGRNHQIGQFISWIKEHNDNIKMIWWDFNSWLPVKLESAMKTLESNWFKYYKKRRLLITIW